MSDDNPRPAKRLRQTSPSHPKPAEFSRVPPANLLISIPSLLVQPPTHRYYVQFLHLSLLSFRKCLSLESLTPEIECRAWTGLAEIGMRVVQGGYSVHEDHHWARGIESEIERAIGKGSLIAQKHPSLRLYRHHLSLLQAKFLFNSNPKFSRAIIKRLIAPSYFVPADPPCIIYAAYLAFIDVHISTSTPQSPSLEPFVPLQHDLMTALDAIQKLHDLALSNSHPHVALLACVLRLRTHVSSGTWTEVAASLESAEASLGLSYNPLPPSSTSTSTATNYNYIQFSDPFEYNMAAHTLVLGITFHTYAGSSSQASERLAHLHALLDVNANKGDPDGTVEIYFEESPPLRIYTTRPRILLLSTFLVSAVAKRDAVGRKPKRRLFASEGLRVLEDTTKEKDATVAQIKADLLSELVGISTMRSEFDAAEEHIASLIAHTRNTSLFGTYAPLIALHHAHLAHALGQTDRALNCYDVAAHLAHEGGFVNLAARAGMLALRIGLGDNGADVREAVEEVSQACAGMGGILEAIRDVLTACLSSEIIKSKEQLKHALDRASGAQDNHLRALILALVSTYFLRTSEGHAQTMLETCAQLAAGLGAGTGVDAVGNASLRLWVGERYLEMYKREGQDEEAAMQAAANAKLAKAIERISRRGLEGG